MSIPRAKFPKPQKLKQQYEQKKIVTTLKKNGQMTVTAVNGKPRFKNLNDWIEDQRAHGRMH